MVRNCLNGVLLVVWLVTTDSAALARQAHTVPVIIAQSTTAISHPPLSVVTETDNSSTDRWNNFWLYPVDAFTLAAIIVGLLQGIVASLQLLTYKTQTKILKEQTNISKKLPGLTQRAFISYSNIVFERPTAQEGSGSPSWQIEVKWRNYGPTPAQNVEAISKIKIVSDFEFNSFDPEFSSATMGTRLPIPPQHDFIAGIFKIAHNDLKTNGNHVVCCICVYYRDIFFQKHLHQARLCFEVVLHGVEPNESLEFQLLGRFSSELDVKDDHFF